MYARLEGYFQIDYKSHRQKSCCNKGAYSSEWTEVSPDK